MESASGTRRPDAKRRRWRSSTDSGLSSLPEGLLASIGAHLAFPSRVIFAVALAAPSSSWRDRRGGPSAAGRAVVPHGSCDILDMSEVEKDLAARLSDDDLGAMLKCVGHDLRKLQLANCLNVTGRGLEPLRASKILRHVDLSLVGPFESAQIEGKLQAAVVAPILQSIIDVEGGSAMAYLSLPNQWDTKSEALVPLHRSYVSHLSVTAGSRPCSGEYCTRNWSGPDLSNPCFCCQQTPCIRDYGWFWGGQNFTCSKCENTFCHPCNDNGDGPVWCERCEKTYCAECVPMTSCEKQGCPNRGLQTCSGCLSTLRCHFPRCNFVCCTEKCASSMITCDVCGEVTCEYCTKGDFGEEWLRACNHCNRTLCYRCCDASYCGVEGCYASICHDCHPEPRWWVCPCIWCTHDGYDGDCGYGGSFHDRNGKYNPRCLDHYPDAKTHCMVCRRKKLRDEDYLVPPIPTDHWIALGFDDAYIERMDRFLQEMKWLTLMLKSGEKVCGLRLDGGPNGPVLQHDDILLPHWREFADALRQYNHEPREREGDKTVSIKHFELQPAVLDMLNPALKEKQYTFRSH